MSEKIEEQVAEFFAKEFSFTFNSVEGLHDLFNSLREFSHHLSENHYYSEAINKKVMSINLDLHSLSLELPRIAEQANSFDDEATIALLAGKKPSISKSDFESFKKKLADSRKRVVELNESLQILVKEIKAEYNGKV